MTREGWSRLAAAIREGDLPGIVMLASRPLRVARFDRMLILETTLLSERPSLKKARQLRPDLSARMATAADLPELVRLFPHSADKYAGRLEGGDECLLVESADSVIAMGWVGSDRDRPFELGCRIELPVRACWGYDTFVLEEHRGQGAFVVLMEAMFALFKSRGVTRLYAAVSHLNTASRASHARIGYTTAVVLERFVVAGIPRHRITRRGGERFWLRGTAGDTPVLRLS
ncbi:MAG TPA: GNAT family N-acetyltransferase [Candidatus Polarisedimenticolia bacterium]